MVVLKLAFVVGLVIAALCSPFAPIFWASTTYDGIRRDSVTEQEWKAKWGRLAYAGLIVLSYAAYSSLLYDAGVEYGLTWQDSRNGGDELYFTRLDSTGAEIGDDLPITDEPGDSNFASLAWTGSEYGVTWNDNRDGNSETYFARFDASGTTPGADLRVTATPEFSSASSLVWTGSHYGVAWSEQETGTVQIYFTRVGCNCLDDDSDGLSVCNDCDDSNANCTSDCADSNNDQYCVTTDCDDGNPNCTSDCTDADNDQYCVTTDCDEASPDCSNNCTDTDSDGFCVTHDCDDSTSSAGSTIFGEAITAPDRDAFTWTTASDVRWRKGVLNGLSGYVTIGRGSLYGATLLDVSADSPAAGSGMYYIVREQGCGSWQTQLSDEPGRDAQLPLP